MFNQFLHNKKFLHDSLMQRPMSLGDLLPYDEYLSDCCVHVLKDGSLGAFLKVETVSHEPMQVAELQSKISSIRYWFQFPSNFSVQIHFDVDGYTEHSSYIRSMEQTLKGGHPTSIFLFKKKLQSLKSPTSKSQPIKRSVYLSIRCFSKDKKGSLANQNRYFQQRLDQFKHHLKNLLENDQLKLNLLTEIDLLSFLRKKFNPITSHRRNFASPSKMQPLSHQILFQSPLLDYDGISREGLRSRTLTFKTLPNYSYPGGMAELVAIRFPFTCTVNVSFPTTAKVNKFLAAKEFFLDNAMSAKAKIQKEEVADIQLALAKEDRCLHATITLTIDGKNESELDDRCRILAQIFQNRLDCELVEEDKIGLGLWLSALPLNYTPDADLSTKRAVKVLRSDLLNFLPVFDSFKGMATPLSLHLSRENNLVPFSLLENETSNHTVVLADTGSGKSAFVIDCIQAAKRLNPEPIVFVIDKKSSYGMMSKYFDGELTVFDHETDLPFSPFRGHYTEEKIGFLTKIMAMAVKLTSPSFKVESEHLAILTKAIREAHRKKVNRSDIEYIDGELVRKGHQAQVAINLEDVVVELGGMNKESPTTFQTVIEPLISKLRPFYGDGLYSRYFTEGKPTSQQKGGLFYVYDLDALDGDPTLQTLMTMSVIEEIRDTLALPEHQGRTGFLIMEEFAMLGRNNPAFRDFAVDFAETMRKRGCWLITLTPRPQNYFDIEVGQAFWSVADNFVFLQMSSDNVDYIQKHSSMLDSANSEIIKSLRTKKGLYADIYYMNKNKETQGAFRFRQTPYDRWLSPTNALDTQKALASLKKHHDKWQALEELANSE